jgi:ABC-2 type transport system ATP-binding protein
MNPAGNAMTIQLQGISKSYGRKQALHEVSLAMETGQVLGYLGPNGAGKTTTVKILTATLKPDSGSVSVCGFDPAKDPLAVKKRVGYVPEVAALYESMTPMEYGTFVGRLHRLPESLLTHRLEAYLKIFELYENRHNVMATFSKGMKQRILILTSLLHNPPVLILDEPLNGLDANAALLLKEIIACLAARGRTVFYCSHLLDVVERVCHRVVILREGRLCAEGTVDGLKEKSKAKSIEGVFSALTSATDWARLAKNLVDTMEEEDVV